MSGSLKRLAAMVIFDNPNDVTPVTAALLERDCDLEVLDWTDPCGGPYMWGVVRTVSRFDELEFFHWLHDVVEPLGGFLLETELQEAIDHEIRANAQ